MEFGTMIDWETKWNLGLWLIDLIGKVNWSRELGIIPRKRSMISSPIFTLDIGEQHHNLRGCCFHGNGFFCVFALVGQLLAGACLTFQDTLPILVHLQLQNHHLGWMNADMNRSCFRVSAPGRSVQKLRRATNISGRPRGVLGIVFN